MAFEVFRIGFGRQTEHRDARRNAALRGGCARNETAVAERDVPVDSGLGGDDYAASDFRASGNAGLSDEN